MKTLVLLLVVAGLAASPAAAQKKDKQTAEAEDIAATRQYQARTKGRSPAGAAKLVVAILFRHASRRHEERKEKEVKSSRALARATCHEVGGVTRRYTTALTEFTYFR